MILRFMLYHKKVIQYGALFTIYIRIFQRIEKVYSNNGVFKTFKYRSQIDILLFQYITHFLNNGLFDRIDI